MLDLDAYLARIGLRAQPRALAEIHRAHVVAIPFENLDPRVGIPVSLEPQDMERKLVDARRGGYCFEQNLLLARALQALGFEVDLMLARVRAGSAPGALRPRTHLVLRVRDGPDEWHADVGFGHGTLLEPLPFGPSGEHEQSGWRFRVTEEKGQLVLQSLDPGSAWVDLYAFVPEPVPLVDVEVSNWYTSTHPHSPFVTGLIVAAHRPDGSRAILSDREGLALTVQTPQRITVTPVSEPEIPELLNDVFGLTAPLASASA